MATRVLLRTLLSSANRTLIPPSYSGSTYLLRFRPAFSIAAANIRQSSLAATNVRSFSTRLTTSSPNDSNPDWSNRLPKDTIILEGGDFRHWLVVMEKPEGEPTREEIIDYYINTISRVAGSYDAARSKIYSVSTRCYYAIGAHLSEDSANLLKRSPGVRWVLPDSYLDVKNKDYGGEPFIDGEAVPYDPKYHKEWILNNSRASERNRRNDRPRRRRGNMRSDRGPPNMGSPPSNMEGGPTPNTIGYGSQPSNNRNGPSPQYGGWPPNMGVGMPPNNMVGDKGQGTNSYGGGNPYQNQDVLQKDMQPAT